jgi:antitoxin component YwqK of YwqJK toxin-antitoxin module
MIKKILKYTLIIIVITLIVLLVYVYWETKKQEQQRKQYPYSEIQIKNNLYFYKNELITGMSYVLGKNSDSTSLVITNGKLQHKTIYKNGKKNGIEERYNDNGKILIRTSYKDDLRNGIEEWYTHDNGTISSRSMYVNDKKEGIDEMFRDNGTIWVKSMYVNDKLEGTKEFYDENGKFSFSTEFRNGVEIKEGTESNSDGQSSEGVFTYETGYRRMKITITPEKWFGWLEDGSGDGNYSGKTVINGKMNGSDLYDQNGIEKRGYVSGSTIYYYDPLGEIKLSKN